MDRPLQQLTASARRFIGVTLAAVSSVAVLTAMTHRPPAAEQRRGALAFSNPSGVHHTVTTSGALEISNPFFQDLGTNGRSCFSCHRPAQAWTITPAEVRDRFERTAGLDPIFRTNDASDCEGADVSTLEDRRRAFSLLLAKGLIRIQLDVPPGAEFDIVGMDDPYGCGTSPLSPSLYRRPLPTTNLAFLSSVMWDGRGAAPQQAIRERLITQAEEAVTGHAQGVAPSAAQLEAIVDLELGLFTAQARDQGAGSVSEGVAMGGPWTLAREPFCIGINDPLDMLPPVPGACAISSGGLDPVVFTLFRGWEAAFNPARQAIARGEAIFNTRSFVVDNVAGLNGRAGDPLPGPIQNGTCTVCHDTPNAGNHSVSMPLNIGVADAVRRTPDLPLYTLRNRTTRATVRTTDPGRAMVTGRWDDIAKFKGPILRGLAARAPFFHDGSAASLADVIAFYDTRFHIRLTEQEQADLLAFLKAL